MAPFFAGNSCDPFTPKETPCTLGKLINFAINVSEPADIAKGIAFATDNNIRLVVRNTGHDYNGKSTGAGALGIWVHNLKDISFPDYSSPGYTGKAIKMGAGVQGFEASSAANASGLTVTGGECPTVGLVGGYTQGGGHSPLSSKYGMAADQALEWEVVTGEGKLVTASPTENADLYWALSGGGGGTYGVVYSLTSKAHEGLVTSGANLTFASEGIDDDTYWAAISAFHDILPSIVDAGGVCEWALSPEAFVLVPFSGPGIPASKASELFRPLVDRLHKLNVTYKMEGPKDFPTYLDMFDEFVGDNQEIGTSQYGGRIIPRSVVVDNNKGFTNTLRELMEGPGNNVSFFNVALNVNKSLERGTQDADNAVNPAFRDALIEVVVETPWNSTAPLSDMLDQQKRMTEMYIPKLEAITPGSGTYLSESDPNQPKWQEALYGANYPRLLSIKQKYDPNDIFYALQAVGSEGWEADIGGKLCKT
ncbi:hypothetical protein ACLMJK_001736 [Lecanora helva]